MWKSRKTLATPIFTASTPLWKKDVEKNRFYTDFLFPHCSFSFSLANVEKYGQWRLLILVLISFTVSAKAGSFFICFSTCLRE